VVLAHNLVLTQVEPATTMRIAALLLPFPLGAGAEPTVTVASGPDRAVFTVTGAWGTDRVVCEFARSAIRVTRDRGRGDEPVFAPGD
jgi:hypothetical protein